MLTRSRFFPFSGQILFSIRRIGVRILGWTLGVWLAAAACAAAADRFDQPITLDLQSADLRETLQNFASVIDAELMFDPGLSGRVTVALDGAPWSEALHSVCHLERLACEVISADPPVLRVYRAAEAGRQTGFAKPFDLDVDGADLRAVLASFADVSGRSVQIDEKISGSLTMKVRGAPWSLLLDEICRLSACRIEWGAAELRISPVETHGADRVDLFLEDAAPAAYAAALTSLPVLGYPGLEIGLGDGFPEGVSLDLRDVPWPDAVEALCESAQCDWRILYGEPPKLELRRSDPRLRRRVSARLGETTLAEAVRALASKMETPAEISGLIAEETSVVLDEEMTQPGEALDRLCAQAGCRWRLTEETLHVGPRLRELSRRPDPTLSAPSLRLRFYPSTTGEALRGEVRFTWAHPHRSALAEDRRTAWQIDLNWIPFSADAQYVLPTLTPCPRPGAASETLPLDLLTVPPEKTFMAQQNGTLLQLADARRSTDEVEVLEGTAQCVETETLRTTAAISAADAQDGDVSSILDFDRLLLATPPGEASPTLAVVGLGVDAAGRRMLALIERDRPDDYRLLAMKPGSIEIVDLPGGGSQGDYRLRLRTAGENTSTPAAKGPQEDSPKNSLEGPDANPENTPADAFEDGFDQRLSVPVAKR